MDLIGNFMGGGGQAMPSPGGGLPQLPGAGAPGQSPMPTPSPGGLGGAPQAMPMPQPKPGLMDRLGNPSFMGAVMGQSGMPDALMQAGQGLSDMGQQEQQAPAPMPPQGPMNNPEAVRAAIEMMQQLSQQGAGPQQPGRPMPASLQRRF